MCWPPIHIQCLYLQLSSWCQVYLGEVKLSLHSNTHTHTWWALTYRMQASTLCIAYFVLRMTRQARARASVANVRSNLIDAGCTVHSTAKQLFHLCHKAMKCFAVSPLHVRGVRILPRMHRMLGGKRRLRVVCHNQQAAGNQQTHKLYPHFY